MFVLPIPNNSRQEGKNRTNVTASATSLDAIIAEPTYERIPFSPRSQFGVPAKIAHLLSPS